MSIVSAPSISASRWKLILQAQSWRYLMAVGMRFHKMADPRPREPSFKKKIATTISPQKGEIELLFYTPSAYDQQREGFQKHHHHSAIGRTLSLKKRGRSKSLSAAQSQVVRNEAVSEKLGFPVLVNFHGGGFTIGSAGDDARWADAVCRYVNAVVVSVEYRLAPEHPFPTAVEDGVDAILYIIANAVELGIDPTRIAVSGFSAGGNMSFTVPLKLQDVLHNPYSTRYLTVLLLLWINGRPYSHLSLDNSSCKNLCRA
jgi:acetyl esterase/lipase